MERSKRAREHRRVREASTPGYSSGAGQEDLTGILLDSDVIIEILRGRSRIAQAVERLETSGLNLYCCAIAWAEVHAGLRPGEESATEAFFGARGEVLLDARTGRVAGSYLSRYQRSNGLQLADALVAAAASTSGLRLWTLNRRHYPMRDLVFYGT